MDVDQALRQLYLLDDPVFVVRPGVLVAEVAAALGVNPSPALGRVVRRAVQRMGARRVQVRKPLVSGLRPQAVPREAALEASRQLRRWVKTHWRSTRLPSGA